MLQFTVPRVVAVSPQMRLVEDNPASISLLDVYKHVNILKYISQKYGIGKFYLLYILNTF
jgi:transformation/transcription domain-associated protein